jgi:glucose-fructose oxidoreductase
MKKTRRRTSRPAARRSRSPRRPRVRYAVVGLGHIAQGAVLPAFAHAPNSELTALISDDPTKLRQLSRRYRVENTWSYDDYDRALESGTFDAVYIALPNNLHARYAIEAARTRKHVLCEKPMALTEEDCERMIETAREKDVRLMIAYRLHFEQANLEAVKLVTSGKLGEPRAFSSTFSMQVQAGDIRLKSETGGGTLWDIGIYCINAARYLFRDEPLEVFGYTASGDDERFREVDEMTGAVLRFPGERIAAFTTSFGAADSANYTILGTKGRLEVENAYEYATPIKHKLTIGKRSTSRTFRKRDQFAAELVYFSDCVREGRDPEPSGVEGLIDVAIIQALYRSAETRKPVEYNGPSPRRRPTPSQEIERPPVSQEPELVHVPSKD